MIVRSSYTCERCGRIYLEREECLQCELHHCTPDFYLIEKSDMIWEPLQEAPRCIKIPCNGHKYNYVIEMEE